MIFNNKCHYRFELRLCIHKDTKKIKTMLILQITHTQFFLLCCNWDTFKVQKKSRKESNFLFRIFLQKREKECISCFLFSLEKGQKQHVFRILFFFLHFFFLPQKEGKMPHSFYFLFPDRSADLPPSLPPSSLPPSLPLSLPSSLPPSQ